MRSVQDQAPDEEDDLKFCPVTRELCAFVKVFRREGEEITTCNLTTETMDSLIERRHCPKEGKSEKS